MDDQVDRNRAAHGAPSQPSRPSYMPPPPPRRRWLRLVVWTVLLAAVIGAGYWYWHRPAKQAAGSQRPAGRFAADVQAVRAAEIKRGDMPVVFGALGTVSPLATVTVRTQVTGQLTEIAFQEGQLVKKGDYLAQVDPRPYQVALEQAQGQLTRDQALLKNAQLDLARYQKLNAQDSIARQQVDTQQSLVQQYVGTIQTDQAAIDNVKLNLAYAHIVAPVDGRIGLRQVDAGNYVTPGDANGIVVITQLQPITVLFTLPEDNLPAVTKQLAAGATLPVTAFDRSNTTQLATGTLTTLDNQIDPTTGTIKLRATFPNTDTALFPSQFVNTKLQVDVLHDVPLVPTSAVQRGAPGTYVYVINQDDTVSIKAIKLGAGSGEQVSVQSGLNGGEKVVIDGADRLKDGAKVTIPEDPPAGAAANGQQPQRRQPGEQGQQGGRRRAQ